MRSCPNFEIVESTEHHIILKDVGPWDEFKTITNGVEEVLRSIAMMLIANTCHRALYYIDSEGECTQIHYAIGEKEVVTNQPKFLRFSPATFYVEVLLSWSKNATLWWREGEDRFTQDVGRAKKFSIKELKPLELDKNQHCKVWFTDYIDTITEKTVPTNHEGDHVLLLTKS